MRIIDTDAENISSYALCGYKNIKQEGYRRKIDWLRKRYEEGMKVKILHSEEDGTAGMIEYVPGEYAWRPVDAKGYMFIHCLFVIHKKHKGKGYGSRMVEECLKDAKKQKMHGVAVVTRKGTWMADKGLFEKLGFEVVDTAPPDFELLMMRFKKSSPMPKFKGGWEERLAKYGKGMTIISSDQCPYCAKTVKEIVQTAKSKYGLKPRVIQLKSCQQAQDSPSPFGISALILEGRLAADHPISNTRFINIMEKERR